MFTTSGKVNMRSGPGKGNKVVTQVEKRGTRLGQLLDAKADNKDVVWFKAKYKGKTGWITSDYADAVAGAPDGSVRYIEGKATELSHLYLRSIDEAMDLLELDEDYRFEAYDMGGSNDAVYIAGNQYTEFIQLDGEGYAVYGVKIGDKIRDAQKKFAKANLVLQGEDAEGYIYSIICSPDSLAIDEYGFDGVLAVTVGSDNKVESIVLQANGIQ